jgi:uncharacterized protein YdeI (YjbR/CyaY-like superfamily)
MPDAPKFFKSGPEFHRWLEKHHGDTAELLLGFYKVGSGRGGITYQQALDEALAFGWIDGVRKSLDDASYTIRFTPRKTRSVWSAVNIKRVNELIADGRMQPAGMEAFGRRTDDKSAIYAYEQRRAGLDPASERQFRANKKAWEFFQAQAPWYQRTAAYWVTSAKKEETRAKRLSILMRDSEGGRRIDGLSPGKTNQ